MIQSSYRGQDALPKIDAAPGRGGLNEKWSLRTGNRQQATGKFGCLLPVRQLLFPLG
jgi:hypothetical protein